MIARVFPRRTAMSPRDSLAFFKEPTIENIADCIKASVTEVHISVTFTWDIPRAEDLYYESWKGHMRRANSWKVLRKTDKLYRKLFGGERRSSMYEIRKDGGVIAMAEAPNYIRRHADGFYILCEEKDAQGVAVDGTAYCLMGRTGLEELDEVQIVERDAGTIVLQQGKDAAMSRAEIETALCDIDAANEEAHAS